jgi:hypothetical protein
VRLRIPERGASRINQPIRKKATGSRMFVRKKRIKGREYFYLVENERRGGKVRQKTIASLGEHSTVEAAVNALEAEAAELEREFNEFMAFYLYFFEQVKALTKHLEDMARDIPSLSDAELLHLHLLTEYQQSMAHVLTRRDKEFNSALKKREKARRLRKKAETLRGYV